MTTLVTRIVMTAAAAALLAAPATRLRAQETQQTTTTQATPSDQKKTAEEEKKAKMAEEIVVTARKREETVQTVPISVAAPTETELRDRGAETIEDVSANVAGFTVQNLGPGQSQVAMRGVSAGQIVRDQPGVKEQVGVYLDESVISLSLFTPDIDLFDLSRIEVLRGPQGTLFGSGSLSGTVRYITNQPQLGVSENVGELTVASNGGSVGGSAKAAVNAPLGDNAALRVAAYYTKYEGFIDAVQPNLSVNDDVNDGYRAGARVAIKFQPSAALSITPRILYQKVNSNGWNRVDVFNILANPFTTTRPAVHLGEREQFTQFQEPYDDKFLLGDVNLTYDLGNNRSLTSITSYSDRDIDVVRDATALTASITGGSIGLPANIYTLDAPLDDATKAKAFTQEVRLAGSTPKLQWLAGAFYSHVNRGYGQSLLVSGFETLSGIPTAGTHGAARDVLFFSDLDYRFKQYALFGEATYSVNPRLDVTGGLRAYNYRENRTQTFDGIFADPGTTRGTSKAKGVAPRVILGYKLSDNTRLNAQISKGFRLGGINDPLNVPLCTAQDLVTFGGRDTWKDEKLWNYEVGSKSTFLGGRGSFNAAAFYMDIRDLQATVTAGSCSSRVIFNVPKARSEGVETEFEVAPNDRFDFAISASHIRSRLESTLTSTDAAGHVSIVAGIEKGNRLPTVPEFQAAAAATFHWPMRQGMAGYLTGAYQHVGDRFTQIGDQAAGFGTVNLLSFSPNNIGGPFTQSTFTFDPKLPAYDLLNLRIGVLRNRWDTALFVNNVTDERALLALDQERGTRARVSYLTNPPRTYGISTRVTF
ncbi:MAG: TonB-dependent receptor [Acidobacteria bacterium]|nr:TonB-dependent receptor [Acidobacteriota bacterium]MBV9474531.1 TonB-dependent receptor [Acidobacteriota bacterium]